MTINEERDLYSTLVGERDEALRLLRLAKAAHLRAEDDLAETKTGLRYWIATAIVLALALVWAVIA